MTNSTTSKCQSMLLTVCGGPTLTGSALLKRLLPGFEGSKRRIDFEKLFLLPHSGELCAASGWMGGWWPRTIFRLVLHAWIFATYRMTLPGRRMTTMATSSASGIFSCSVTCKKTPVQFPTQQYRAEISHST